MSKSKVKTMLICFDVKGIVLYEFIPLKHRSAKYTLLKSWDNDSTTLIGKRPQTH
jgi:hypothetical protein